MPVTRAVILAAGKGRRLDRQDAPKPLVRIGHKPLILWTVEQLQEAGFAEIAVVVGEQGDLVRKELLANPAVRATLRFVKQREEDGMLASILAAPAGDGPLLVTACDLILERNPYPALRATAVTPDEAVTLVGMDREAAERSGALSRVRVSDGAVTALGRDLDPYDGLEAGVYLFGKETLERLRTAGEDRLDAALERGARDGRLRAAPLAGEWYDVNTPATAVRAEIFVERSYYALSAVPAPATGLVAPIADATFGRTRRLETKVMIRRGLLDDLGTLAVIDPARRVSPHFLLTDSQVDPLYGDRVLDGFRRAGYRMVKLVMPAGEHAKSIETYTDLAERILSYGMDEGSVIVDVGGGVVNNMAGFLAATLYRGVGLVHIPTTTMAQVDAAIDFKQAVNSKLGKNLTGAYHPASHILIDPETAATLPERHVRNGLAESLKHALTQDQAFFRWFMDRAGDVRDVGFLEEVIRRTIALKVPLLSAESQTEENEMLPQYGHSVGHAVEHLSGYELLHGEAVAIGMCVTAEAARIVGVADDATVDAHYALCERYGLPTRVPRTMLAEDMLNTIRYDKHYLGGLPRMALLSAVGKAWRDHGTVSIPVDYPIIARAIAANQSRA